MLPPLDSEVETHDQEPVHLATSSSSLLTTSSSSLEEEGELSLDNEDDNLSDQEGSSEPAKAFAYDCFRHQMVWQALLFGGAFVFASIQLSNIVGSPSTYVASDYKSLRENYHDLEVLSFTVLQVSWTVGVLPLLSWQLYDCIRGARAWKAYIPNDELREQWQSDWKHYRQARFLEVFAALLAVFPIIVYAVFREPWANQVSRFTTVLHESPPQVVDWQSPGSFVDRFFPTLASSNVINNLLPASICWISILMSYAFMRAGDAFCFLSRHVDIKQPSRPAARTLQRLAAMSVVTTLLVSFVPFTAWWLCRKSEGGGIEVYLSRLMGEENQRDATALLAGWVSESHSASQYVNSTLCFNMSHWPLNITHPNATQGCIEPGSFEFIQSVAIRRWEGVLYAAWGYSEMPVPWKATMNYTLKNTTSVILANTWEVSEDHIFVFPFINLGEFTLFEEFGAYTFAVLLFYVSVVYEGLVAAVSHSGAVNPYYHAWCNDAMDLYQKLMRVADDWKLWFIIPTFTVWVLGSKFLGEVSDAPSHFWEVFNALIIPKVKEPEWESVSAFDAIVVVVWFSADLLLTGWLVREAVKRWFERYQAGSEEDPSLDSELDGQRHSLFSSRSSWGVSLHELKPSIADLLSFFGGDRTASKCSNVNDPLLEDGDVLNSGV